MEHRLEWTEILMIGQLKRFDPDTEAPPVSALPSELNPAPYNINKNKTYQKQLLHLNLLE